MQNAELILDVYRQRGSRGLPVEGIYRQLFNPDLYLRAYGRIYRNDGAMTPGVTVETVDGMSRAKIDAIIADLRTERFRWTPVRRVEIPKRNGKMRPLGIPMLRAYCVSLQASWGFGPTGHVRRAGDDDTGYRLQRGRPRPPARTALLVSLRRWPQRDERCPQRCRFGLRSSAMISGVSRIHHGPCGLA